MTSGSFTQVAFQSVVDILQLRHLDLRKWLADADQNAQFGNRGLARLLPLYRLNFLNLGIKITIKTPRIYPTYQGYRSSLS